MDRVNVFRIDDNGQRQYDCWFDLDAAVEIVDEGTRWDGSNNVSVHNLGPYGHERLIRTQGGRWVLDHWSRFQGHEAVISYVTDEKALEWLMINGSDDIAAKYFGDLEPEKGPGRPAIGGNLPVTPLGDELLALLDSEATQTGKPRAAVVRELLTEALKARHQQPTRKAPVGGSPA
ncbi:CopG family transcriptional regulator [Micromonospora sp. NPDC049230]|uniref:ribbon-helix-helix domain-containing protein n=1 Tax=Micromonospora sp. NPDC049230 TaxID=3155502 RepID=UPI0034102471